MAKLEKYWKWDQYKIAGLNKLDLFMYKIWLWIWTDLILHSQVGFFTWTWIVKQRLTFFFNLFIFALSSFELSARQQRGSSDNVGCNGSEYVHVMPAYVELFHLLVYTKSQYCYSTSNWVLSCFAVGAALARGGGWKLWDEAWGSAVWL